MLRVIRALLAALLLSAASVPVVSADTRIPLTGDRVALWADHEVDLDAGQPFYVEHGYCVATADRTDVLPPYTRYEVAMNEVPLVMGTAIHTDPADPECGLSKMQYHNFRFGLPAGDYVFESTWWWLGEVDHTSTVTIHVH
jgi:hypothetical protein